ncbi:nose resistant to fluoxetine protein 6-like [Cloeon dipterum]|uniref:nose resistant to fluoxetine protein 6-like n=1 Tax=Cloeon dipterum TaxID=197152 RepID=UPI00321F828F
MNFNVSIMPTWTGILLCLLLVSYANGDCDADVDEYFQGLNPTNLQLWSLEMFDSSTKFFTDGVSELAFIFQLANFDQCMAVNGPKGGDGKPRFNGQYCLFDAGLQLPSNADAKNAFQLQQNLQRIANFHPVKTTRDDPVVIPTFWGVCAPSSCGADGVKRVADFNMQFLASVFGSTANTTVRESTCYYDKPADLDAASWCFIIFASLLICLILVSTILECFFSDFDYYTGWKSIFNAFSLKQTLVKDLFRLPKGNTPGHLECLHGIRTLSMLWIVLCHTYVFSTLFPGQNYVSFAPEFSRQWFMAPILNGFLAVDTFFLLSGLLTVYVPLMDLSKGRKFNVLKYYLYRYLRITIPLAVAIWLASTLYIYAGKGPMWSFIFPLLLKQCHENWWANLLYISNYFFYYCMNHTWFLCVDMQLALLAPLIIYPLMKWPKYGLSAICVLTLGSVAAIFAVTYTENLPWTGQPNLEASVAERYDKIIYANTPMRASPYLIGMALGYFLSKKHHVHLPKWGIAVGWFTSTAVALTVIFLILIPYSENFVQNALEAAFYASLHKPAWSLCVCWTIWACVNGYGGVVNRILSWKYFVPASKLTFCGYLMHIWAILTYIALRQTPYYVSHVENLFLFGSFLILTLPYTIVLHLAVEAPTINLLRLAFKKRKSNTEPASGQANKAIGKEA